MAGKNLDDYLFESERGGKLTKRTAQKVFENGVDVRYVQEPLGHWNIRTTQIYTQVTNPKLKNIKSPL